MRLLSLPPSAAILHFPHVLSLLHAPASLFLPFCCLALLLAILLLGGVLFFAYAKMAKPPQWLLSTLSHGFVHKASRLLPAYQPPLTHCGPTMAGEAPASRPTAWVFLGGAVCGRFWGRRGVLSCERLTLGGQPGNGRGHRGKAGHAQIKIQCLSAYVSKLALVGR